VMAQPEVYWNPDRPADNRVVACGIEKILAPGDAIAWFQIRMTPQLQRTLSLLGTPQIGSLDAQADRVRLRSILRRDWPKLGSFTIVVAPLHPETNELLEELGFLKATVVIVEPHEDPAKTRCTEVKQLTRVPAWALPMAAAPHFKQQLDRGLDYAGSVAYKEVTEGAGSYIVVGMRRCVKGPPLLPCECQGTPEVTDWGEAESGGVRLALPEYLQTFLKRIGVEGVDIYDRLHGREVVRYQAVVQRRAWEQAWTVMENPFRLQRAAYRRLHGGTNAPALTIDMAPKFLLPNSVEFVKGLQDNEPAAVEIPTARTFIHFSASSTKPQPRLGSEPAYIDIDYYRLGRLMA